MIVQLKKGFGTTVDIDTETIMRFRMITKTITEVEHKNGGAIDVDCVHEPIEKIAELVAL